MKRIPININFFKKTYQVRKPEEHSDRIWRVYNWKNVIIFSPMKATWKPFFFRFSLYLVVQIYVLGYRHTWMLVPVESRRKHQTSRDGVTGQVIMRLLPWTQRINLGPLEQQHASLTAYLSPKPHFGFLISTTVGN